MKINHHLIINEESHGTVMGLALIHIFFSNHLITGFIHVVGEHITALFVQYIKCLIEKYVIARSL